MKQWRVNERIRVSQVRLIGEEGAQLGVMSPIDALRLAREQGLDLVEVAPNTAPPVCRILDFNKFRYEEQRREREAKKKHHVAKLKEVKFKPRIEAHDYRVKLGRIQRFLTRGDKVKITMVYRGREMAHLELGRRVVDRLIDDLKSISKVERTPIMEGRFMTMVFGADREKLKRAQRQATRQRVKTEAKETAAPSSTGVAPQPASAQASAPTDPSMTPQGSRSPAAQADRGAAGSSTTEVR